LTASTTALSLLSFLAAYLTHHLVQVPTVFGHDKTGIR
jgi:hypothetical protein